MASHMSENLKLKALLYSLPSKNSDIVIVVEGRKLYFYKQLLCLVSPVFKSMLCSDFKEQRTQTINLEGKTFAHLVMLLAWIDPGVTSIISENEAEILCPLADEYDISTLRGSCETVLQRALLNTGAEVVMRYINLSERHNFPELRRAAIKRATTIDWNQLKSDEKTYNSLEHSTLTQILENRLKKVENRPKQGFSRQANPIGFSFSTSAVQPSFGMGLVVEKKEPDETIAIVKYCTSSDLTDVAVVVEEKKLFFYSDILRRTSSSFCSKLDSMDEDREISLDVGTVQEVSLALEFLDPSSDKTILTNVSTALKLFSLSLEYDIPVLHEACENYIRSNISSCDQHDLTWCILLADRGQCSELLKVAKTQTRSFTISVLKETDCYKQLNPMTRIKLLEFKLKY